MHVGLDGYDRHCRHTGRSSVCIGRSSEVAAGTRHVAFGGPADFLGPRGGAIWQPYKVVPHAYGEQKAGRRQGRTIQCPTDVADLGSTDTYCVGELPFSANWPAQENLAPVQGPRCPALKARAGAGLGWTALLV